MNIVMDGVTYRLGVLRPSLSESFRIEDGPNADTLLTGERVRDVVGTYYDHTLEIQPDPRYYSDYIAFYHAISAPVAGHTITLPHEEGDITYRAEVASGSHYILDATGGNRRYRGLTVNFKAMAPQREAL